MSTVKTNTLTGTTSAGSIVVTGEGGSTTTNLQQGLVKVWWQFDPTNSNTTDESFNVSGIVDNGTGDTTTSFTNAFSGARDYSTAQCHAYTNNGVGANIRGNGSILRAAGSLRSYCVWVSNTSGGATVEDDDENSWQLCGDLA
jgi:hypothetical protein